MSQKNSRDNWLDVMPHKALVWHEIHDLKRSFMSETTLAIQLKAEVLQRIASIERAQDEPIEVLENLKQTLKWLQERLT